MAHPPVWPSLWLLGAFYFHRRLHISKPVKTDPLKEDFRNFLWVVWEHLNLPNPTPVQYDIAQWLQHGPKRMVIEAFRGVGKSWVTSAYVCWLLYCDPQRKILVVSASKQRADDFSTFTLRLINEIPVLKFLQPGPDQRSSKVAFDVGPAKADHSPSVKSVGITGQLTGSRADYIVADDIEVPNNSATQALRDKLSESVKEFDSVLKPGGSIVYLGTPQTELSIYNKLPDRGYTIRIWPARFPSEERRARYGSRLAPYVSNLMDSGSVKEGDPVDPQRFSHEDLLDRELSLGRQTAALQFMLDTTLSDLDKYPLKLNDMIVYSLDHTRAPVDFMWAGSRDNIDDLPCVGLQGDFYHKPGWVSPETAPYEGSVMFIDPSGKGKDETAYAIVNNLHSRLFLIASGGFRDGYSEQTLEKLLKIAQRFKVNKIICEPNYGGGMFTSMLKAVSQRVYAVGIEDATWSKASKEARIIDTLEPILNQHRLVVNRQVIENDYFEETGYDESERHQYRLMYQLTRVTRDKGALAHDDRLDALAGAVGYWTEVLARDTQKAVDEWKHEQFQKEIDDYLDHTIGLSPGKQSRRWASGVLRNLPKM